MVLMRPILQALRDAALGCGHEPVRLAEDWADRDWMRFVEHARHHRVAPLLAHRIQHGALISPPDPVARLLQKELHATRLRHGAAERTLREITDAFGKQGLAHVCLKGPPLADEAYETAGLRAFDDLDVLVEPDAAPAAGRVLEGLGYVPAPKSLPPWLVMRYHFHSQWAHPQTGQIVELHGRPADAGALPRTRPPIAYLRDLLKNPAAMPVYLAVHLAKHAVARPLLIRHRLDPLLALHPWSGVRLIWLVDFQGLCAARGLARSDLADIAERWRCRAALDFTDYLLDPSPAGETGSLPRFSIHAALLRRFEKDLHGTKIPSRAPWWLNAHPRTGFRPIRLLDALFWRTP